MKSPSEASSSAPTVWSRLTRSRDRSISSRTRSSVMSSSCASSACVGLAAELLAHLAADALQLVDLLDQVDGQPDGARLVGHRPADRLPDPPGGVGRELEALGVVELLDRTDQAQVALLDQVQERHAVAGVALGQRHDQAQVGAQQVVLGPLAVAHHARAGRACAAAVKSFGWPEQVRGVEPGLDALGQLDLVGGGQQGDLADLVEVHADQVGRGGRLVQVEQGRRGGEAVDGRRRLDRRGRPRPAPAPASTAVGAVSERCRCSRARSGGCGRGAALLAVRGGAAALRRGRARPRGPRSPRRARR